AKVVDGEPRLYSEDDWWLETALNRQRDEGIDWTWADDNEKKRSLWDDDPEEEASMLPARIVVEEPPPAPSTRHRGGRNPTVNRDQLLEMMVTLTTNDGIPPTAAFVGRRLGRALRPDQRAISQRQIYGCAVDYFDSWPQAQNEAVQEWRKRRATFG